MKNVTTAEGGIICLNLPVPFDNEQLYKDLRLMTLNCQTKDAYTKSQAGGWRYDIVGRGMKINMADVNAAIGLAQIRQYDTLLTERKRIYNAYDEALSQHDWAILPPSIQDDSETSYHVYPLRIGGFSEQQRDELINEVALHEVAVNVHFVPLPMLSYYRSLGYNIANYPNAHRHFEHEVSLPVYPQLTNEQIQIVIATVVKAHDDILARHQL